MAGQFGQFGRTVRYLGPKCLLDTSVLVPKCPDTSDLHEQCRSTVPKCLSADLSLVRCVRLPITHSMLVNRVWFMTTVCDSFFYYISYEKMSNRDILSSLRQMHFPECVCSALDYLASVSIHESSTCSVPAGQVEAVKGQIVSEFIFFLHMKKVSSCHKCSVSLTNALKGFHVKPTSPWTYFDEHSRMHFLISRSVSRH